MEGMQEDVECTTRILEGRFRVLESGIQARGPLVTDNIQLTCCVLHSFLLKEDGLDHPWDSPMSMEVQLEPRLAGHSDTGLMRAFGTEEASNAHRELGTTAIGQQQAPPWTDTSNQHLDNSVRVQPDKEACLRRSSVRVPLSTLKSSVRTSSSGQGALDWEPSR